MEELQKEVAAFLKTTSANAIIHINPNSFIEIFYKVFKRVPNCAGCGNEVLKDLELLTRFSKGEIITINKNMKYTLKKDALVYDKITNAHYSEKSSGWSDEIALNVLHFNSGESAKFEKLPEDWEKQAATHGKKVSKSMGTEVHDNAADAKADEKAFKESEASAKKKNN